MKQFMCLIMMIYFLRGLSQDHQAFAYEVIYAEALNAEGAVSYNLDLKLTLSDAKYRYGKTVNSSTPAWITKLPGFKENVLESYTLGEISSNKQYKVGNFCGKGIYIVVDSMPKINWQFNDKTKQIAGFKCKGATGMYRGRAVEAFYTEEIPIPIGPYKLIGLPGLILYAASTDGDHVYEAKEIQKVVVDSNFFDFNNLNLATKTYKELSECEKSNEADMEAISKIRALQRIQDLKKNNGTSEDISVASKTRGYGLELIYEWETPENASKKE